MLESLREKRKRKISSPCLNSVGSGPLNRLLELPLQANSFPKMLRFKLLIKLFVNKLNSKSFC